MTPILTRRAFDELRARLTVVPPELFATDSGDFGLETFWCGLFADGVSPRAAHATLDSSDAPTASPAACVVLNHVSVVHQDTKTIRRHATRWAAQAARSNTSSTSAGARAANATGGTGLKNYLIARWPRVMNVSGRADDVHHRLHRNRCWGIDRPTRNQTAAATASLTTVRQPANDGGSKNRGAMRA